MNNIFYFISFLYFGVSLFVLIYLYKKTKKLDQFQKKVFSSNSEKNLEEIILDIVKQNNLYDQDIDDLFHASNQLSELSQKSLSNIGIIRFNPYEEKGHKECFAFALMDYKKNGVILSTLNTGSGTKVFLKKITKGESDIPLTGEEKEAMGIASKNLLN